jgi:hypothetical protein
VLHPAPNVGDEGAGEAAEIRVPLTGSAGSELVSEVGMAGKTNSLPCLLAPLTTSRNSPMLSVCGNKRARQGVLVGQMRRSVLTRCAWDPNERHAVRFPGADQVED